MPTFRRKSQTEIPYPDMENTLMHGRRSTTDHDLLKIATAGREEVVALLAKRRVLGAGPLMKEAWPGADDDKPKAELKPLERGNPLVIEDAGNAKPGDTDQFAHAQRRIAIGDAERRLANTERQVQDATANYGRARDIEGLLALKQKVPHVRQALADARREHSVGWMPSPPRAAGKDIVGPQEVVAAKGEGRFVTPPPPLSSS